MQQRQAFMQAAAQVLKQEATAVLNLQNQLDDDFANLIEAIYAGKGRVVLCGIGKSGQIARKISATLASTGTPSLFLHAAEALHGDLGMVQPDDIIVAISNSGESDEILRLLPFFLNNGNLLAAITNNPVSALARQAKFCLLLAIKKEACPLNLAPTTSTTATLALGDALAVALMTRRGFKPENYARFHPAGSLGKRLTLRIEDLIDAQPFWVELKDTVPTLLTMVSSGKKGLVPVLDNGKLAGVFTDGDLRRNLEKHGKNLFDQTIKSLITANPRIIMAGTLAADALQIMEDYNITAVPVLNAQQQLVGVVNIHDILKSGLY